MYPAARTEGLIIEELEGETLVYDLDRHRAHCLNPTAARVWSLADGKTSPAAMAAALSADLGAPRDEELVGLALERLQKAGLLREPLCVGTKVTRRDLAGRLGLVGALSALLPVVTTLNAPAAAQAESCRGQGQFCEGDQMCCKGLSCQEFVCSPIPPP